MREHVGAKSLIVLAAAATEVYGGRVGDSYGLGIFVWWRKDMS